MWRRLLRIWSSPRTVLRSVLSLDDTSHAIALGAAIGMLVGMTPTVGLQTVVVMAIALSTYRLFYFNRAAALLMIYVSNPLTMVPIYYGLYWVGTRFLPGTATVEQFRDILTFEGFAGWWTAIRELAFHVGRPLCLGTLIVAPLGGLVTYPATLVMLRWFRGPHDSARTGKQLVNSGGEGAESQPEIASADVPAADRNASIRSGDPCRPDSTIRQEKPVLTR
ncbi:MAG: DUF2062 domain-containing protein [Planctomycetaceae bacterium]